MGKVVSIRVSEEQYARINKLALDENKLISELIVDALFPEEKKEAPHMLNINMVIERIKEKKSLREWASGKEFVLSDLYSDKEWTSFYNGIPFGKRFNQQVNLAGSQLNQLVEWLGQGPSPARYRIR